MKNTTTIAVTLTVGELDRIATVIRAMNQRLDVDLSLIRKATQALDRLRACELERGKDTFPV